MAKEVIKPFDWTYTTTYNGTLFSTNKDSTFKVHTKSVPICGHPKLAFFGGLMVPCVLMSRWRKRVRG